jgi:hypothetical protein
VSFSPRKLAVAGLSVPNQHELRMAETAPPEFGQGSTAC